MCLTTSISPELYSHHAILLHISVPGYDQDNTYAHHGPDDDDADDDVSHDDDGHAHGGRNVIRIVRVLMMMNFT